MGLDEHQVGSGYVLFNGKTFKQVFKQMSAII